VYGKPTRERSILISLLSPLLFLAPEGHLREMEKLWTDEIIIEAVWKSFMAKLLGEWEGVILCVRCYIPSRVAILQSHVPFCPVDLDSHGQCGLSRYSWRRPIQS
jgi:hypothetical protein